MHLRLGVALRELGSTDEAVVEFRQAVALAPEDAATYYNLGSALASQGEHAEAVVYLERAEALAPEDALIRYELGEALRWDRRFEDALERFAAAIGLDPPAENARLGQAEALVNLGQFREARQRLEEAKELLPESRSVDFALAWILASCPDPELRDGARALELANSVFAARRSLGAVEILASAQAESGSCAQAAKTQEFAVEQAEGFALSPETMARLESNLERFEQGEPCGAPAFDSPTERPHWPRNRTDR
jgi:tetratricopeptide (TPR) repeat protein